MEICLVTALGRGKRHSSDEVFHITEALQRDAAPQNGSDRENVQESGLPGDICEYLQTFSLHQNCKTLEPLGRVRQLPALVPSRSKIFRADALRWEPWM